MIFLFFVAFFNSCDVHISELAILFFIIYYLLFESLFSFTLRLEMHSKMFVCRSLVFSKHFAFGKIA